MLSTLAVGDCHRSQVSSRTKARLSGLSKVVIDDYVNIHIVDVIGAEFVSSGIKGPFLRSNASPLCRSA